MEKLIKVSFNTYIKKELILKISGNYLKSEESNTYVVTFTTNEGEFQRCFSGYIEFLKFLTESELV
jgi:hypothetical protein